MNAVPLAREVAFVVVAADGSPVAYSADGHELGRFSGAVSNCPASVEFLRDIWPTAEQVIFISRRGRRS